MDLSLVRLIQAAETLKPVTPAASGEDNQVKRRGEISKIKMFYPNLQKTNHTTLNLLYKSFTFYFYA